MTDPRLSDAVYILPLHTAAEVDPDLETYLRELTRHVELVVVDGSPARVFRAHRNRWPRTVRMLHAPTPPPGTNGKVVAVNHAVALTTRPVIVVADADVRYGIEELAAAVRLAGTADVVRPQNYFDPLPWHALWDTGRTLVNRVIGSDYPGTLVVRREAFHGHVLRPDVLFENLQTIRMVKALGGTEHRADDLYVARRPCSARHFLRQRVRQAYDSQAQPWRLVAELSLVPLALTVLRDRRRFLGSWLLAMTLAEIGRRRAGGAAVLPATATALAPLWLVERAMTSWLALALRVTGGCPYAGRRVRAAADSTRSLRRALAPTRNLTPTKRSA